MNLRKLNLGLVALLLGLGLVLTQSAFTATTDTYWVFDGNNINQARIASYYHEDSSAPSCTAGSALPCKLKTDAMVNDEAALDVYLNTFASDIAVRDAAIGKRN